MRSLRKTAVWLATAGVLALCALLAMDKIRGEPFPSLVLLCGVIFTTALIVIAIVVRLVGDVTDELALLRRDLAALVDSVNKLPDADAVQDALQQARDEGQTDALLSVQRLAKAGNVRQLGKHP